MKFNPVRYISLILLLLFVFVANNAVAEQPATGKHDWKSDQEYRQMLEAAKTGDAEAQYKLVRAYARVPDPPFAWAEAEEWLQKAAAQGNISATMDIGRHYGGLDEPDYRRKEFGAEHPHYLGIAFKWFLKAAEAGNGEAKEWLNNFLPPLAGGEDMEQSYREAFAWYSKVADRDSAHVQQALGRMYAYGLGTKPDGTEALKQLSKSAAQNNTLAACDIGVVYLNGAGVKQDTAAAVKQLRKTAEDGSICGCKELGKMYRDGNGGPVDLPEAFFWFSRADQWIRESGDAPFWEGEETSSVLNRLSEKQVIEIRERAFSLKAPSKP